MRLVTILLTAAVLGGCGDNASEAEPGEAANLSEYSGSIRGVVTYRERKRLRLDAEITVRLEDVSLADAPAVVLAQQTIPAKGKSVPIPFKLDYDPGRIDDRYTYALRAEIRGGEGELLWTTTTRHAVLTRDAPQDNVEIVVESVER